MGASSAFPNSRKCLDSEPPLHWLLLNKPEALLARCSEPSVLFVCGGLAGALGKTATAPLDRLKLMLQVRGKMAQGKQSQFVHHLVSAHHCPHSSFRDRRRCCLPLPPASSPPNTFAPFIREHW